MSGLLSGTLNAESEPPGIVSLLLLKTKILFFFALAFEHGATEFSLKRCTFSQNHGLVRVGRDH